MKKTINNKIDIELMKNIILTKKELESANKNFEMAEAEMIDFYIYQIKANQAKLDYLIKKTKQKGMAIDIINKIALEIEEVG